VGRTFRIVATISLGLAEWVNHLPGRVGRTFRGLINTNKGCFVSVRTVVAQRGSHIPD
jgi:hypothetical protein